MSNRTIHNIKSTGQALFTRATEDFSAPALANVQFGPKKFMRMDVFAADVTVTTRKHRHSAYVQETALHGELGARISS